MEKGETAGSWHRLLRNEFEKESDRAAVILTASLLDMAMLNLLKTHLAPTASNDDELFDGGNAPLGSFSSKIQIGHRLGLISSEFARDLNLIRKIRNEFAHNVQGCEFEQPQIKQRVAQLCMSSGMIEKDPALRSSFPDGIRGDFLVVASWMLYHINGLSEETRPIALAEREFHYTDVGDEKDPRNSANPMNNKAVSEETVKV